MESVERRLWIAAEGGERRRRRPGQSFGTVMTQEERLAEYRYQCLETLIVVPARGSYRLSGGGGLDEVAE